MGVLGGAARHRAHVVVTEELASLWQATVSGGQRGLQPYGPDVVSVASGGGSGGQGTEGVVVPNSKTQNQGPGGRGRSQCVYDAA